MNRIYKVIWSKVKHQYVVTSEFAHSCTKSTGGRISRSAAAVLAALVLTMGVGSVQAEGLGDFFEKPDGSNYWQSIGAGDNYLGKGNIKFYEDGGASFGDLNLSQSGTFWTEIDNQRVDFTTEELVEAIQQYDQQDASIDNINTQIGDLQETDQKHNSQIGALQETDQKHDSQIGALQETDQKHDSQIGALQETDQKHDSQIGALQATDRKHDYQISANSAAIAQNRQDINNLNHRVDNLDSRIDKVGAGAAALAALHPLDFDPDAKWDFAAGYGNYNGENAVAVGTFYRPNEDTMFSVGGTFGNGENMINAGVSLKIGAGSSHVTTSRTAMAKEIKSMRDIVAKQDAQIQKLTAMVNALVGVQTETDTTTMFPDVPENHWAYEAVAAMAKSGLVKGYPDGEFKGDRNMTRYEFAQIVYNAIQAGAEVDARLVEEFKPELEYFHIATVAKDKDGNPTIERVRAN